MKVLVLTRSAWDDTNSTGNTMTNFFSGWDCNDIANIYCRAAKPNNNVCQRYYSIFEKDLLKSIFKVKNLPGREFVWINKKSEAAQEDKEVRREEQVYDFFRKNSFVLAYWGRELLWKAGKWKNNKLKCFLLDFKPDIIFAPCFAASYTHSLIWYMQKITNAKVVLFHADDYLSVKGVGISPLSTIKRRLSAKVVKRSAEKAELNYCISPKQQEEYSQILQREMKLLYKGADFSLKPDYRQYVEGKLIRIVYMGSTLYGRWNTLGMLARAIQRINRQKPVFELLIYSQYQPTKEAMEAMVLNGASRFMGKVPASEVQQALGDADIVLHVESFNKKERLSTRLSFSTKIVDCLHSGRCVFAIGWEEAASIDYLIKNDAAIAAVDEDNISSQLERIAGNPDIILEYAQKAWDCGTRNHKKDKTIKEFYNDLNSLVNK